MAMMPPSKFDMARTKFIADLGEIRYARHGLQDGTGTAPAPSATVSVDQPRRVASGVVGVPGGLARELDPRSFQKLRRRVIVRSNLMSGMIR